MALHSHEPVWRERASQVLGKEISLPCENLGSEMSFGGGNILNELSLMEFILVRMQKAVCVSITKDSIVADRMCNGKAMQQLHFPIFM